MSWGCLNNELAMTYSHMGNPTLPSARRGFTSEFGKGSGGSLLLWSPAQLLWTCSGLSYIAFAWCFACNALLGSKWVINRLAIGSEVYCLAFTKSSFCLIVRSIWNRLILTSFEVRTTTAWVLYSQASRAISIGQLHISLCFHIQPINVVVFNGSLGGIKPRGNLILR